jgi:hypothetical protein
VTEQLSEQAQLALKTCRENLHSDFDELFQAGEVDAVFDDSVGRLQGDNTIDDYIPAIAERLTRERLKGVAQRQGLLTKQMPRCCSSPRCTTRGRARSGAALMRADRRRPHLGAVRRHRRRATAVDLASPRRCARDRHRPLGESTGSR